MKKKKNTIAALLVTVVAVVGIFGTTPTITAIFQSAQAWSDPTPDPAEPKAPMASSQDGNNVYIVWWTNRSGNWEVMFRASNDGGATFGDKINVSNSPDTQSRTAEILAIGNNMVFNL
jgi:hypothetical protein